MFSIQSRERKIQLVKSVETFEKYMSFVLAIRIGESGASKTGKGNPYCYYIMQKEIRFAPRAG